uniref:Multiple inositol polyphosphate phosphatase 1 n=1 Tax=Triticum aestivum TaxID=4565 RepID=A0FHB1_WHEAT|nr:multiple inositol polyphosphate phosphatase PhyIIa2 [Triticum aestivum]
MAPPATPLPFLVLLATLLAAAPLLPPAAAAEPEAFDVRRHLSTVTRYDVSRASNSVVSAPAISDECRVIHLNLVARHGTRAPTKKRIKELDRLAVRLGTLVDEAKQGPDTASLKKIPSWMKGWESRWKGRVKGGELVSEGEEELFNFANRVKERFQDLFDEEYHPDVYSIRATQVPRASASAVAFGLGLLSGKGKLGAGNNRAFSVLSESRASDICLRFFDSCKTYKDYRKRKEPDVDEQKEPILEHVTSALVSRYHLKFTTQDVSSLWFLCKQEASLLNITNQACQLFNEDEVHLLEWTDDLGGFVLKGYGESINYKMGLPLLKDVVQSMEEAIIAKEENFPDGTYEKARLRFAHAETLVPFTCLLGLFLEGSGFEKIQREEPLDLPPMPPQRRNWRGALVAPFASNNMLALYQCPGNDGKKTSQDQKNSYFVQVLHNEAPVSMPGCGNKDLCPFEEFKEKIVKPHLEHEYDMLCKKPVAAAEEEPSSFSSKLNFFLDLLSRKGYRVKGQDVKTEL